MTWASNREKSAPYRSKMSALAAGSSQRLLFEPLVQVAFDHPAILLVVLMSWLLARSLRRDRRLDGPLLTRLRRPAHGLRHAVIGTSARAACSGRRRAAYVGNASARGQISVLERPPFANFCTTEENRDLFLLYKDPSVVEPGGLPARLGAYVRTWARLRVVLASVGTDRDRTSLRREAIYR